MLDIETLGKGNNSVILSISAVVFDIHTGETGAEFHVDIDTQSCLDLGLEVNGSTITWWMNQSESARKMVFGGELRRVGIAAGLLLFKQFIENNGAEELCLWGRSPRFDVGIIENAARKVGSEDQFWNFRLERDVRTVEAMAPQFKAAEPVTGIPHYGLDDAKHQIKYTWKAWNYLINK